MADGTMHVYNTITRSNMKNLCLHRLVDLILTIATLGYLLQVLSNII